MSLSSINTCKISLTFSCVLEQFMFTQELDTLFGVHVELFPSNGQLLLFLVVFTATEGSGVLEPCE